MSLAMFIILYAVEHVIRHVHYIACCGRCFCSEVFAGLGSSPIFAVSTNLRSPRPMAARWTMQTMLQYELSPFVDLFICEWPSGINQFMVQRAISQCTSLDHYMKTLPQHDNERAFIYGWLYPSVPYGYTGWSCLSPLNKLNYVLLSMRSRYAAMAAMVMIPSLYADATPHAMAGIVLRGFLQYVHIYDVVTWKQFVNIGNRVLICGRLSILQFVKWIYDAYYLDTKENYFMWQRDSNRNAPPQKFPYSMH